jgi:hypothetical protein
MDQRPPADEVTRNLATTAAKILALAAAGYDRADIRRILGISYQQVRKVMLDAGITGGLRRAVEAQREPILVEADPARQEPTSSSVLLGGRLPLHWRVDPR